MPKQVLLVDDDPAQLSVRQLLLNRVGVASQLASSARTALALLRSATGQPSIGAVVTDHLMPDMNGAEFVRELRSFDAEIPVIVISGLPDAHEAYSGLQVHFLAKPCEPEELIASVKNALLNEEQSANIPVAARP
jgi:DNA-binding NtrC family response regulator